MRTRLGAALAAALIALPALATEPAPPVDYGRAIEKRWDAFFFAWVAGDAQACATFFSEDGIHFRPGGLLDKGREEIRGALASVLATFQIEYVRQTTLAYERCGDQIVEYGLYTQKWRQADREMTGGYFAVWTIGDGGILLLHRLIFN